jgi:type IV pilus assembly protein PilM
MSSFFSSPPADAALEIGPESVALAVVSTRGGSPTVQGYAVEPLPPGAVVPSLTDPNIVDRDATLAALRSAVDRLGVHPRRVALLIPDVAARVSLLRFDKIPTRRDDLEQLVRWQLRKSAPFPIDDAVVTYSPGLAIPDGGRELVAVMARQATIREYESLCEALQMHPGLVDLATLGLINVVLAAPSVPQGDWLVVHVRPGYTSLAIMRGRDLAVFRNVPTSDADTFVDIVHQTSMYHEDRLGGGRFSSVLLAGYGTTRGALDEARRRLEARLDISVEAVDAGRAVAFTDRVSAPAELASALAPALGTLLRMHVEATSAA